MTAWSGSKDFIATNDRYVLLDVDGSMRAYHVNGTEYLHKANVSAIGSIPSGFQYEINGTWFQSQ